MKTSIEGTLVSPLLRRFLVALALAGLILGITSSLRATIWDGGGDGITWTDPLNWDTNTVPTPADVAAFGLSLPVQVLLNGDQTVDSLSLLDDYTIGAFGTGSRLLINTASIPNISVDTGVLGTLNARLGTADLNIGGGGTLYLTNLFNTPGNVLVDSSTLMINSPALTPHVVGTGVQLNTRSDVLPLGTAQRNITLTNGGEFKIIGTGYNPDGGTKNFILGAGGGAINPAAGFQFMILDDAGTPSQISGAGNLTKNGVGRLQITTQDYNLTGNLIVNAGVMEFNRLQGGAAGRFSAFSPASTITVNGGMLVPNNGTAGVIDNALTLNVSGVLATNGQDHQYGATAGAGTPLVLNGGTILSRDAFNPQTQRFIRFDSLMSGSGTVDLLGSTNAGGAPRVVFQRGDLAHTFNGTFRILTNTTLEANPRHSTPVNVGRAFGDADLELNGFNSGLDLRDNGTASGVVMNYNTNDVSITSTDVGGIQRLQINQNAAGSTGNTFSMGNLSMGNHWFQVTGGNSYQARFSNLNLAAGATSRLDVISAPTFITNAVAAPTANLIRWASNTGNASALTFEAPVSLNSLDIRHGNVTLARDAALTLATGPLRINAGGNNNLTAGSLTLDNVAINNTDRLPDGLPIEMRGGSLTLVAGAAAPATETTGNVTAPFGNPLFAATPSATQGATLTLGTLPIARGPTAVGAFTGRNLGLGGATDASIVIPGVGVAPFLGPFVLATGGATPAAYPNEWAKHGAAGVTPFVPADYVTGSAETTWAAAEHIKQTGVAAVTLTANRNIATLNLQPTGAGQSIATNGNLLTVEQGGILSSANTTAITGTATGGLTAGTGGATGLFVSNGAQLDINAIIQDHPVGGAVTLVKSAPGVLRLTTQNPAAPHSNTFTGGVVVNNGTLEPWRMSFLGPATNGISLNGGRINFNIPNLGPTNDGVLAGGGHNVTINANSFLDLDNNGETGGTGVNNTVSLGSLTNNGHNLGFGGFDNYDAYFANGATFAANSSITMVGGRDANSNIIINGLASGPDLLIAAPGGSGGNPQGQLGSGGLTLGGGAADSVANTLGATGSIFVNAGTLRLNKANGTTAIPGNLIINGGNVFVGPPQAATPTGGKVNFAGWGFTDGAVTSGQNQIADTATVTLFSGNFGENNRITNERIGSLIQKNGTLNPGVGRMEIGTATISGGNIAFNSTSTLAADRMVLEGGAPNLSLANNSLAQRTVLEIGTGGLSLTGQSVFLASGGGNLASAGGELRLGGPLTVNTDPLNAGSYTAGIFVQVAQNFRQHGASRVDLAGGTRTVDVAEDAFFHISAPIVNGGLIKDGPGILAIENFLPNTYAGPVTIDEGTLYARGGTALGTDAVATTTTTVNAGGTLKLEDGQTIERENFILNGAGAFIPRSGGVREQGALVSEAGVNRIVGSVTLGSSATISSNAWQVPSLATSPLAFSNLIIASPSGVTGTGTLTLSGNGDGTIQNGVSVTGGLIKDGSGTWTLSGTSSYPGSGLVAAGTLELRNANLVGGLGTRVMGDATLELQDGVHLPPVRLNGNGVNGRTGALHGSGALDVVIGNVSLETNSSIRADGNLLLLGGVSSASGRTLTLTGSGIGDISFAGIATGAGGLVKNGTGLWRLGGNNTFTGPTSLNGGTLELLTSGGGSRLSDTAPLNLGGGSLSMQGTGSETVGGLTLVAGDGVVNVREATLTAGALTRSANATMDVQATTGSLAATGALTNGILPYARYEGVDFATITGGNIVANTSYTTLAHSTVADTNNSIITTSQNQSGGSVSTNSLKMGGTTGGLALGANSLTLLSGGVLYAGNSNAGISGIGTVSGPTANDELIVHTSGGALDIGAPIIGAGTGSLTKAGPGSLVLSGTSSYTGNIFVNDGTLAIAGPGGTTHPAALGAAPGGAVPSRNIVVNGGAFSVFTGDYDPSPSGGPQMQVVIGPAGGTLDVGNGNLLLNDTGQFAGTGDLTKSGGGRLQIGTAADFPFDGDVNVTGGILESLGNGGGLGGRPQNVIALNPGTALINQSGTMNNNIVMTNAELYPRGADRTFQGTITLNGTNTIAMVERDTVHQNRAVTLSGRVLMTDPNSVLNLHGSSNGQPLFLSGPNDIRGTVNLGANAGLELRQPGALRDDTGFTTVNLNGNNSRLLLRHYQDGDYNANVNVNATVFEISADRLANNTNGQWNYLSINNLTINQPSIWNVAGGNNYSVRVAGTATFNGDQILNNTGAHVLFENGLNFTAGGLLDKRHNGVLQLTGRANPTTLLLQGHPTGTLPTGGIDIRGANGALVGTTKIDLRGGDFRVDNSEVVVADRVPDTAAIILGGGAFRTSGPEVYGPMSAPSGQTLVSFTPISKTVTEALTLTGFTRSTGAQIVFTSEFGTLGATNATNVFATPRIIIPGQANVTGGDILPWATTFPNEFAQYDGTTIDGGQPRGVIQVNNNSIAGYNSDPAEGTFSGTVIARMTGTTTTTMTANRSLRAIKMDGGSTRTIDQGAFTLTVDRANIIHVANNQRFAGTAASILRAGTGMPEFFFNVNGGNLRISPQITNNSDGTPTALVKSGPGTLTLDNTAGNSYTGGTFVNNGVLDLWRANRVPAGNVTMSGGQFHLNVPLAGTNLDIPVGNNIVVEGNSFLSADNNGETTGTGTDHNLLLGSLTINGPYTLTNGGFDSYDFVFANGASLAGTPTFDQGAGRDAASTTTINGAVTGSGFYVAGTGGTPGTLELGGGLGDAAANTFGGKVSVLGGTLALNKADGTTALPGDLEVNGGTVRWNQGNQMLDGGNIVINNGSVDLNAQAETISSVTQNGGFLRTGAAQLRVTGNYAVNGIGNGQADGVQVNSGGTLSIDGNLTVGTFGRVVIGAGGGQATVGGALTLTGSTINLNGDGNVGTAATLTLNGDVTSNPATVSARIEGNEDSNRIALGGTRTFTVAQNAAADNDFPDLIVNGPIVDGASPGGLIKEGSGVLALGGAGANAYTGPTVVNNGTMVLRKPAATVAVPNALTIGNGTNPATVALLNSNQIADTSAVTINANAVLNLDYGNASERVGSITGAATSAILTGPDSLLSTGDASDAIFAGTIHGAGGIVKEGAGKWTLAGTSDFAGATTVNAGILQVDGTVSGTPVAVNAGGTLQGIGTISTDRSGSEPSVAVNVGGTISPGVGPGILTTGTILGNGGTFLFELNGTIPGAQYDQIQGDGLWNLTGAPILAVNLGFAPTLGDTFDIGLNDATDPVTGTFTGLPEGQIFPVGADWFQISYVANADAGSVGNDIRLTAVVPEPGSVLLLLAGALGVGWRRRRAS
ncbi:MAG: autotransporter-associated beta strand repeat-containing protein [Verrucomicrobiales bacterium]